MRILVVEDDPDLRRQLADALSHSGYAVDLAADGEDGHFLGDTEPYDAVILDLGLPKLDGVTVLERWRNDGRDFPVLILTARDRWSEKVKGFDAGADDYLGKPFDPRELVLRINNILKRVTVEPHNLIEQLVFGPFNFPIKRRELKRAGTVVKLTERERDIMVAFATNPGETVSRYDLVSNNEEVGERTIDVQINRLRRKIEEDPANPRYLQTIRGIGYRLATD